MTKEQVDALRSVEPLAREVGELGRAREHKCHQPEVRFNVRWQHMVWHAPDEGLLRARGCDGRSRCRRRWARMAARIGRAEELIELLTQKTHGRQLLSGRELQGDACYAQRASEQLAPAPCVWRGSMTMVRPTTARVAGAWPATTAAAKTQIAGACPLLSAVDDDRNLEFERKRGSERAGMERTCDTPC